MVTETVIMELLSGTTGDCLIAAVALRLGLPVLHRDRAFEVLARHCGLQTVSLLGD